MMFLWVEFRFHVRRGGVSPSMFVDKLNFIPILCFGWRRGRDDSPLHYVALSHGATPRPRSPFNEAYIDSRNSGITSAVAASRPKHPAIIMSPKGTAEDGPQ